MTKEKMAEASIPVKLFHADGTPRISHDDVVRVIKRITDTHVILECGRMFVINDNLKIEKF